MSISVLYLSNLCLAGMAALMQCTDNKRRPHRPSQKPPLPTPSTENRNPRQPIRSPLPRRRRARVEGVFGKGEAGEVCVGCAGEDGGGVCGGFGEFSFGDGWGGGLGRGFRGSGRAEGFGKAGGAKVLGGAGGADGVGRIGGIAV